MAANAEMRSRNTFAFVVIHSWHCWMAGWLVGRQSKARFDEMCDVSDLNVDWDGFCGIDDDDVGQNDKCCRVLSPQM